MSIEFFLRLKIKKLTFNFGQSQHGYGLQRWYGPGHQMEEMWFIFNGFMTPF